MIVLRLILVLGLIGIAGLVLAWLLSGNRKYLQWATFVLRVLLMLGVIVALVFIAERLILI